MKVLDGGRISIAALALGMAQGAFECSLRYAQQRKQFGKAISEFQSIQNYLADMATEIDAARLLTYRAGWAKDQGRSTTKESAMAKLYASEVSVRVANLAVQIHGGYGFTKDFPAEKFYRDVEALHDRRRHVRDPADGRGPRAPAPGRLRRGFSQRIKAGTSLTRQSWYAAPSPASVVRALMSAFAEVPRS